MLVRDVGWALAGPMGDSRLSVPTLVGNRPQLGHERNVPRRSMWHAGVWLQLRFRGRNILLLRRALYH